ncbi:MAG: DMT family transporter [Muribaculaceae bacterium]|nr:DMT family transporter [Muribaculaceae bacterium]
MTNKTKGFILAMLSSCTFGMIPLFSMPCLNAGMDTISVITFRYGLGCLAMLAIMLFQRLSIKISFQEAWRIFILALFNNLGAFTLIYGYKFMDSGAATTIQFSYPVFTCIIMMMFFNERLTLRTATAIVLAVVGVGCLSGFSPGHTNISWLGVFIELMAGLTYAIYLVLVPTLKVRNIESSKLTFYVFLLSTLQLLAVTPLSGGLMTPTQPHVLVNLLMLGLIPTAISNFTLILGLKKLGSTLTSILGALEPLTAMVIGVFVFSEKFTLIIGLGFIAIITSVLLLILHKEAAPAPAQD